MDLQILRVKREQMWSHLVAQFRQVLQNGASEAGIFADGNDPDYGGTTYPPIGDAGMRDDRDSDLMRAVRQLSPVTLPIAFVVLARADYLKIRPGAKVTICHESREGWTAVARWTAPLLPGDQIPGDVRVQTESIWTKSPTSSRK